MFIIFNIIFTCTGDASNLEESRMTPDIASNNNNSSSNNAATANTDAALDASVMETKNQPKKVIVVKKSERQAEGADGPQDCKTQ